ncbi:hypothetical protein HJC23_005199 [Cyclotella cryptica]|uniref:Uncharacterized protein n=1 Tax=Cyclotella cryptica TaxID=29204 RepID=A0ABD3NJ24_9STRA
MMMPPISTVALALILCFLDSCISFTPGRLVPSMAINKHTSGSPSASLFVDRNRLHEGSPSCALGLSSDVKKATRGVESHEERRASSQILFSFSLVAACRRLSFLLLSIALVNTFRSTVLKIPKSTKNMFDECPWPFTLFHDPVKFLKDSSTWIVFVWVGMCQVYSLVMKARAAGSLPSKIFV